MWPQFPENPVFGRLIGAEIASVRRFSRLAILLTTTIFAVAMIAIGRQRGTWNTEPILSILFLSIIPLAIWLTASAAMFTLKESHNSRVEGSILSRQLVWAYVGASCKA